MAKCRMRFAASTMPSDPLTRTSGVPWEYGSGTQGEAPAAEMTAEMRGAGAGWGRKEDGYLERSEERSGLRARRRAGKKILHRLRRLLGQPTLRLALRVAAAMLGAATRLVRERGAGEAGERGKDLIGRYGLPIDDHGLHGSRDASHPEACLAILPWMKILASHGEITPRLDPIFR